MPSLHRRVEVSDKCPVMGEARPAAARHTAAGAMSNYEWWPNQLNPKILHQNSLTGNPRGEEFQSADEFKKQTVGFSAL
jgi:catalase-peroxidase